MNNQNLREVLFLCCCFFIGSSQLYSQESFKPKFNNSIIYIGIEVGSKGVKLSVVELGKNAQTRGAFNVLKDSTINTDFISFSEPTFQATLDGLYGFYTLSTRIYKIPSKQVFTVISSGVRIQAEKDNKFNMITSLINEFRIGEPILKLILIPLKVAHAIQNSCPQKSTLLNIVDKGYTYENPDHWRLPGIDTPGRCCHW